MKLDSLEGLNDGELQVVISHARELLKMRDEERKAKAIDDARAILATAGLKLSDVAAGKRHANGGKAPAYRGGRQYQHPANKTLVWNARGQKPTWLRELETEGRKAIELPAEPANENIPPSLKKTG